MPPKRSVDAAAAIQRDGAGRSSRHNALHPQEQRQPRIANSFATALRNQCSKIAGLPGTIGRSRAELQLDLRSFVVGNYLILFRYTDDEVEIVNVVERHRDIAAEFETDAD